MAGLRSYSSVGIRSPGVWRSVTPQAKACVKLTLCLRVASRFLACQTMLGLPRHPSVSPKKEERR